MPVLTVVKNYLDNTTLTQAELDQAFQSVETFINTTKLDSTNLQSGAVVAATLGASSVTTAAIASKAVTATQLANDPTDDTQRAVGSDHIKTSAVITSKIADSNVTTAKIADANVTQAKLQARATGTTVAAGGVAISASSGNFFTTSGSWTDATNLSVTLTTTGRPVMVCIISDGSGNPSALTSFQNPASNLTVSYFRILRGATEIYRTNITVDVSGNTPLQYEIDVPPSSIMTIDPVSAGTYTYKVQVEGLLGSETFVAYAKLVAFEL